MGNVTADLGSKVSLVTGGGRGIGRAIAVGLGKCGSDVVVVSRTAKELDETRELVLGEGADCLTLQADVSKKENADRIVQETIRWKGRIDILVNSAGKNIPRYALDITEDDWDEVINLNLRATFFCCQAAGREMIRQKGGRIINITSQMSLVGYYKRAAYCASKGAVMQMSKVLAIEWAPYNVNVNCIAPTFLKTPFTAPMFEDKDFLNDVLARIPMGRIGSPEDVVGAAIYLASDSAKLVTGSTMLVDGGWVAW